MRPFDWSRSSRDQTIDPTPDDPGIDDEDLDVLARRIDHLIRRQSARDRPGTGISVPLAVTWRGSIIAILGPDRQEFTRLTDAVRDVLGPAAGSDEEPTWIAIATAADGVRMWSRALVELQESLRIARAIGRHGVIDDVAELGVERLLLGDPDLAATIIERELGALLDDPRMGEELVETLQVYVDAGGNRRETARRLHLADRTVAYRLERAEQLLGHGFDGEPGRRMSVALTLRRLAKAQRRRLTDSSRASPDPLAEPARAIRASVPCVVAATKSVRDCAVRTMTRAYRSGIVGSLHKSITAAGRHWSIASEGPRLDLQSRGPFMTWPATSRKRFSRIPPPDCRARATAITPVLCSCDVGRPHTFPRYAMGVVKRGTEGSR